MSKGQENEEERKTSPDAMMDSGATTETGYESDKPLLPRKRDSKHKSKQKRSGNGTKIGFVDENTKEPSVPAQDTCVVFGWGIF